MNNKQRTELYVQAVNGNKLIVLDGCDNFIIPSGIENTAKNLADVEEAYLGEPQRYLCSIQRKIDQLNNKKNELIEWMKSKNIYMGDFIFYNWDGSFEGGWQKEEYADRKATKNDMILALEDQRYTHLKQKGYRPILIYGNWRLVPFIKRIDENHLQVFNITVEYKVDHSMMSGEKITFHSLTCLSMQDNIEFEIKNWSIIQAITFFLNHEKIITEQSP